MKRLILGVVALSLTVAGLAQAADVYPGKAPYSGPPIMGVMPDGGAAFIKVAPSGNIQTSPATVGCSNTNLTSPDGGTDWCTVQPVGTVLRLGGQFTANMNYTFSLNTVTYPDAGSATTGATTADKPLAAGAVEFVYLPSSAALVDGGVPVCFHLDAVDVAAGARTCP